MPAMMFVFLNRSMSSMAPIPVSSNFDLRIRVAGRPVSYESFVYCCQNIVLG